MRFLSRRVRTQKGPSRCARCDAQLTHLDEWRQRCPQCYQWLPFRDCLEQPDELLSRAGPAVIAARNGRVLNGAQASDDRGLMLERNGAAKATAPPAGTAEETPAARVADTDPLITLQQECDRLEAQVRTLRCQLVDATIERAQLMGFVAYLLGRALLCSSTSPPVLHLPAPARSEPDEAVAAVRRHDT